MAGFIDKMSKLPKWAVLAIGGTLILGLGFGMYYLTYGSKKKKGSDEQQTIILDVPDAAEDNFETTALGAFQEEARSNRNRVADYWESLGKEEDPLGGPQVSTSLTDDLDPNEYSELERYYINNGFMSKEEIDRRHAADRREREAEEAAAAAAERNKPKPLTQQQQDSLYFNRLERAYAMAAKYSGAGQSVPEPEPEPDPEPSERKIDLEAASSGPSALPTESYSDDGIISSLDEPSDNGLVHYGGKTARKPVKATFLKNGKLVSGNRVILRLLQDMTLSDGTVIPANTHVTGTCSFSRRLKINITMLHYGGRMFPVDISAYDNDGTEGIYCPMAEESESKGKKAKEVAGEIISGAGSAIGTLVTGNPLVGGMATRGLSSTLRSVTGSLNSDGSVSVNVSAGYEFFLFENDKEV